VTAPKRRGRLWYSANLLLTGQRKPTRSEQGVAVKP